MKRLYPSLNSGEVPEALDRRILAAAAFQARKNRARRVFQHWMWSGAAAAAAFLIAGGIFFLPGGVLFCTGREYRFRKTDKDLGWERIEHYIDTAGLTGM